MRSFLSVRKFFAYFVLACWLALTADIVMTMAAQRVVVEWEESEQVLHPNVDRNLEELRAVQEAQKTQQDLIKADQVVFGRELWGWLILTLVGSALLAERRETR